MKICKRCLYPQNHSLGIILNEEGICSGCRVHEEKNTLHWQERFDKLVQLVEPYKSKTKIRHDCIVPVSGAGDSYFIVDVVKNKLGLNPLLVAYNCHHNTNIGIHNFDYLKALFDCDCLIQTINPATVKAITKATLREFGNMYWHCAAASTAFPVQLALRFNIPLIIWGAHSGSELFGAFSYADEVEMCREYHKNIELEGVDAEGVLRMASELSERDLFPYYYPKEHELTRAGVRGIYLSNYIPWDSKKQHEKMMQRFGYETMAQTRTFNSYSYVDTWNYTGIHDVLRQQKTGISVVVDDVCREIRFGRMTKAQGARAIVMYQQKTISDVSLFLEWLGMSMQEFDTLVSPHTTDLNTLYIDELKPHMETDDAVIAADFNYVQNSSRLKPYEEKKYILVGRGWLDGWHGNP